jgi:hypothetical protein
MGSLTANAEGRESRLILTGLPPHRGRLSHRASNFMREFL